MNKLQRDTGASLDDDSALMLMARQSLGGPEHEGRAAYQIALSVCPRCSQVAQQANGELVPVGPEIVAMAECDAQHLGVLPSAASANGDARAPERVEPDAHAGAEAKADAHGGARAEAKAERADDAHTGARAKQDVPPAMRRTVLRRDHRRCTVPGCRNARFLDIHHIQLSSEGGCNQPSNLTPYAVFTTGPLTVASSWSLAPSRRASASVTPTAAPYGQPLDPRAVEVRAKAFAALRNLGFREGEVRAVLAALSKEHGGQLPCLDRVLRDALDRLSPPSKNPATSDKRRQT